jgi:F-type H+-transporting ATPase subunit epsilon
MLGRSRPADLVSAFAPTEGPGLSDLRRSGVARQVHIEIVSVEEMVWSGEGDMLVARTTEGELGVLPGHAPLLGQLAEPSQVRVKLGGGGELAFDVSGGFLSVTDAGVTVLAEDCTQATSQAAAR